MNPDPEAEAEAKRLNFFLQCLAAASQKSLLDVVVAVAEASGVPLVRGLPVRQLYARETLHYLEEEVAHYADQNIAAASHLKQMLENWKQSHGKIL